MDATTVAVDLAKDVFEVALANRAGRIVERKRLTRPQFERFIDGLTPETEVVMEACGTAHYWGRRCQARQLRVRLLPGQYVRPYVRRNKTDRTARMPIMARSSHALRQQAEYTTASDFDHRRDHFLADVREESIYTLLVSRTSGSQHNLLVVNGDGA